MSRSSQPITIRSSAPMLREQPRSYSPWTECELEPALGGAALVSEGAVEPSRPVPDPQPRPKPTR
jgi:hypothetical protein